MLNVLPWFLPGVGLSFIVAVLVEARVGRWLGCSPLVAGFLIVSLGIVLSATVIPLHGTFESGDGVSRTCDFSRIGLAPVHALRGLNDTSLNIVLFVPLGAASGLLPGTRRTVSIVAAVVVLPVGIETLQLIMPVLGRGCQSADVIDNLTGLVIGMAVATVARWLLTTSGPPRD